MDILWRVILIKIQTNGKMSHVIAESDFRGRALIRLTSYMYERTNVTVLQHLYIGHVLRKRRWFHRGITLPLDK